MNKKKYYLQGLNCANCAVKIQDKVAQLDGVTLSHVDFATSTLLLEFDDSQKETQIEKKAKQIVKDIEPDVLFTNNKPSFESEQLLSISNKMMIVGGLLFLIALFVSEPTIRLYLFVAAYVFSGYDILYKAFKNTINFQWFDENFLMSIATLGAFAIHEYPEAVAVMLFYKVGEFFQNRSVAKSRQSIVDLLEIAPQLATIIKDDLHINVHPTKVNLKDIVYVKAGDNIPVDGYIIEGTTSLDVSSLTGESQPVDVMIKDEVYAGSLNLMSPIKILVTKTYDQSAISKMIELVEGASLKKAKTEKFITKFAKVYTPIVVLLAFLLWIIPVVFFLEPSNVWLYRSLVFLVISCPCALVISIPLSYFSAIGVASKKGILIKGAQYLETLYNVDTILFDKTGTLTKGIFEVEKVKAYFGYSEQEVIDIAVAVEKHSNHPIAKSIIRTSSVKKHFQAKEIKELAGFGLKATVNNQQVIVGSERLLQEYEVSVPYSNERFTSIYVVVDHQCIGEIVMADRLKEDSAFAIEQLRKLDIHNLLILSGDKQPIVDAIQNKLGLNNSYGQLLPHQKLDIVNEVIARQPSLKKVAYVGDGINDAATLANVDVGIAMGGLGSDIAIESADIIIVNDEPSKIAEVIAIARKTRKIVMQNIIMAMGVKLFFLFFGAIGLATLWEAVFADVGVAVLAVFNAMRILKQ